MRYKKRIVAVLALFLVPAAWGQVVVVDGHVEEFDVGDGVTPSSLGDWWSVQSGNQFSVIDQRWLNTVIQNSYCSSYTLTAPPVGADWTMEFELVSQTASGSTMKIHARTSTSGCSSSAEPPDTVCQDGTVENIAHWFTRNTGDFSYNIGNGFTDVPSLVAEDGYFHLLVNVKYTAATAQLIIKTELGDSVTKTSCETLDGLPSFQLERTSTFSIQRRLGIDNLRWDNGTGVTTEFGEPLNEGEPSEFDAGFTGFVQGLGFRTPESLMMFAVGLIGMTTVAGGSMLKFASPGKWKNFLILGSAIGMGVFAYYTFNIDFWMIVLAIVLGFFAVQGSREARNTYREVKETIRSSVEGSTVVEETRGGAVAEAAGDDSPRIPDDGDGLVAEEQESVPEGEPVDETETEAEPEVRTEDGEET